MKYFRPDIELGTVLGSQDGAAEKLGGLPWGLAPERWPICACCKKPQTLLAELHHDHWRLNLGAAGRVLFVFHCAHDPGMCDDWDQDSGGNAVFVVESSSLGSGLTRPPVETPVYPEARILFWTELDDGIPSQLTPSFFSDQLYLSVDESVINQVRMSTKLGSVPAWIQSPGEAPSSFRFVGQLDSTYSFHRPLPSASLRNGLRGGLDVEAFEGRIWWAEGPNFGDGGIGYLFLKDTDGLPEAKFFWQCG